MRVAAIFLRKKDPARIVVAVPVDSRATCEEFESALDITVCAVTPEPFLGVGQCYADFRQTSDEEVRELLRRAAQFAIPKAA